jgi:hypothetical protein
MARFSHVVASGNSHHVIRRSVRSIPTFDGGGGRIAYLDCMAEEWKRVSVEVRAAGCEGAHD